MMKLLVFALVVLQLANYITGQCGAPWTDVNGQCMICNTALPTAPGASSYTAAQTACDNNLGNLATIVNTNQANFAFACGTGSWMGYTNFPYPKFVDGTGYSNVGGEDTATVTPLGGCFVIDAVLDWNAAACADNNAFTCSKPYSMCPVVEVQAPLSVVSYAHADTRVPPANYRWEQTVVTYGCATGFTMVGAATRTCLANGMWSGAEPSCIHTGVCSALAVADHSTLTYSPANPANNNLYIMGTVAIQLCATGYEKEGGTYTRTCQADGTWTGSMIVCAEEDDEDNEDDDDNALALGLGLGLGALALVGLGLLLWCCLCRPRGPGMSAPPPVRPYPPVVRRGYPRPRGYPRRVY